MGYDFWFETGIEIDPSVMKELMEDTFIEAVKEKFPKSNPEYMGIFDVYSDGKFTINGGDSEDVSVYYDVSGKLYFFAEVFSVKKESDLYNAKAPIEISIENVTVNRRK